TARYQGRRDALEAAASAPKRGRGSKRASVEGAENGGPVARVLATPENAQELYEGAELGSSGPVGLITYMRTDSTRISDQARTEAAAYIGVTMGQNYLRTGQARHRQ